jgi:hypothetical protein
MGRRDHRSVAAYRRAPASPLTSTDRPCGKGRRTREACGAPAARPASRATVIP